MAGWLRLRTWKAASIAQDIAARIAALPHDEPIASLHLISVHLADLGNAQAAALAASQDAAELLDQAARARYREATRRYLQQGRRSAVDEEARAQLASAVDGWLRQLAQRYQAHAAQWRSAALRHAIPKDVLVRALTGGIRACAGLVKWSYLRHSNCPVGVWADMGNLYAAAESAGCARLQLNLGQTERETCAEREFLKPCLLAAAAPEGLTAEQTDIAERLAGYCASDTSLASQPEPYHGYVIDLESGEPPWALNSTEPLTARARSFGMHSGDRLRRLIHVVERDRLPHFAFGVDLDKVEVLATLEHLLRRWLITAAQSVSASHMTSRNSTIMD